MKIRPRRAASITDFGIDYPREEDKPADVPVDAAPSKDEGNPPPA